MAAQRQSREHWYVDLRSGETRPYAVKAGQRVWVTHAKLVDPATAAADQTVRVALRTRAGDGDQSLVLSAERPRARVLSAEILEDEFWLERDEDDSADAVVRFRGQCVYLLAPVETVEEDLDGDEESDVEDDDDDGEVAGMEDGEDMVVEEYEVTTDEEIMSDGGDGDGISGDEEEEGDDYLGGHVNVLAPPATDAESEDGEEVLQDDAEAAGSEVDEEMDAENEDEEEDPEEVLQDDDDDDEAEAAGSEVDEEMVQEYEETHVASIGSTAGFMRVVAAVDAENQGGGDNDRQILVFYRYTLFSAASFDGGVEACGSAMEHQLRFIADGGHGARSLAWAGASLVPLIYPGHSSNQLKELWSTLIAGVSTPPRATRVEVVVVVGILWPEDRTPARMGNMRAILKDMMAEPWPGRFTDAELHLPEPVRCGHDDEHDDSDTDGEQRPAKRRRVVDAGESCTVCLELLEGDDLAAWPGCGKPHVFHGRCMELVLEMSVTCPICRRKLYTEPEL